MEKKYSLKYEWEYLLTSDLKVYLEEYKINMKDVLNIRSEFTTTKQEGKYTFFDERRGHILDYDDQFFTYLATILIELDPL